MSKNIFISQPMNGRTDAEILDERERMLELAAREYHDIRPLETFFTDLGPEQPLGIEVGCVFDTNMNPLSKTIVGIDGQIDLPDPSVPYVAVHTHPDCNILSPGDLKKFVDCRNLQMLTADCHNGHVFAIEKTAEYDSIAANILVSDLHESYEIVKKQFESGETSERETLESVDFLVRMCLNELQGYGVKFYE